MSEEAVQLRLTCEVDTAVPLKEVGVLGAWISLKVAVMVVLAFRVTLHVVPLPLQVPPDQETKPEPVTRVLVRVMTVPWVAVWLSVVQEDMQLILPPVTVPSPVPALTRVRVKTLEGRVLTETGCD